MIITARNVHYIESPNRYSPGPNKTRRNTGSDARQTPNALYQLDVTQRRTGNPGGEKAKPSSMQPLVAAVLPHVSTRNHASQPGITPDTKCVTWPEI